MSEDRLITCEMEVEIETITPVLVWSGRTSIIDVDAFIVKRGDKSILLVASDYCTEKAASNLVNRFSGQLGDLASSLSSEVRRLLESGNCPTDATAFIDNKLISLINKNEPVYIGFNHIPESSVKGLVRTTIIANLMARELKGKNASSMINDIVKQINKINKKTVKHTFRDIEGKLLTVKMPYKFVYDVFQRLSISRGPFDSRMIFDVFNIKRIDNIDVAKLNVLAMEPKSKFRYKLIITRLRRLLPKNSKLDSTVIRKLDDLDAKTLSCSHLINSLKFYSNLLLETELNKYSESGMQKLAEFIERIKRDADSLGEKYIPLKVGLKTGHNSKTIAPILKNPKKAGIPPQYHNSLIKSYENLTNKMSIIYRKKWDDSTITVSTYSDGLPVGWMALKIISKGDYM